MCVCVHVCMYARMPKLRELLYVRTRCSFCSITCWLTGRDIRHGHYDRPVGHYYRPVRHGQTRKEEQEEHKQPPPCERDAHCRRHAPASWGAVRGSIIATSLLPATLSCKRIVTVSHHRVKICQVDTGEAIWVEQCCGAAASHRQHCCGPRNP
jgi:hypothetical protein